MTKLLELLRITASLPAIIATANDLFRTPKSGESKEAYVRNEVTKSLDISTLVTGKDIVDRKKFDRGIKKIIEGVVDVMNATVWSKK